LGELSANKSNLFTGSLKSLSSVRKVWKRYHAVLADSSLYLYDSNAGSERVSKLMDVRKCQVLETPETKKERWCFDVCNHESKEHWLLATETEAEKNQVSPLPSLPGYLVVLLSFFLESLCTHHHLALGVLAVITGTVGGSSAKSSRRLRSSITFSDPKVVTFVEFLHLRGVRTGCEINILNMPSLFL
jgi:hypothetical protein